MPKAGFDITEYRDMWMEFARTLGSLRDDNRSRALLAKDMSELAKFQGIEQGLALADSFLAKIEREHEVNPTGRPAFEENTDA